MIIQSLVEMLVRKIEIGEINPVTGLAFRVEDIKVAEYKNEVIKRL
ncbi:hypothetical protein [Clostridium cylindrosporum]|uniref:Uncharacterized protein n=1 Tax=Clostridium cylindrosporum DSM 605 TaxID=1121307 RepID=A0A0J8D686_CLOCY|nr:hypothetical protein [Clostridium cylindrosporum]KMT21605.1 hypothetical protein CLCY_2c03670 [Clostridium cylindrosporum DSM 605]